MMKLLILLLLFITSTAQLQKLEYEEINPLIENYINASSATPWSQSLRNAASTFDDSSCMNPGDKWFRDRIKEIGTDTFKWMIENRVTDLALVYKAFVDNNEEGETFGLNGQHTQELQDRHVKSETFWERTDTNGTLDTDDILLLGMHGRDLKYDANLVPTVMLLFDTGFETALRNADQIQEVVRNLPHGFDNPLLTYNAYAMTGGVLANGERAQDSIIIGDGILEYLDYMGLESDGPDFLHAHEYGHHMQFEANIGFESHLSESEDSRRFELMADAFAAYFLAHDHGGDMSHNQIKELHETAFHIGDCNINADTHHGTPLQRKCATIWGASQAVIFGDTVLSPRKLRSLFDADLEDILDLNKETCALVIDGSSDGSDDTTHPSKSDAFAIGSQIYHSLLFVSMISMIWSW